MDFRKEGRATIIEALIIYGLSIVLGFVVGVLIKDTATKFIASGLTNIVAVICGSFFVGMRTTQNYWRHLCHVGLLIWIFGILNVALGVATPSTWFFSLIWIALFMAIGGGLRLLLPRASEAASSPSVPTKPQVVATPIGITPAATSSAPADASPFAHRSVGDADPYQQTGKVLLKPPVYSDPYQQAGEELLNGTLNPAIWARSLVEGAGNDSVAKAAYVKLRVAQLNAEMETKADEERRQQNAAEKERSALNEKIAEYAALNFLPLEEAEAWLVLQEYTGTGWEPGLRLILAGTSTNMKNWKMHWHTRSELGACTLK